MSLATIVQIATLSYYWLLCRAIGYSIIPLATPYVRGYSTISLPLLYRLTGHSVCPPIIPLSTQLYHWLLYHLTGFSIWPSIIGYSVVSLTTLPCHWSLHRAISCSITPTAILCVISYPITLLLLLYRLIAHSVWPSIIPLATLSCRWLLYRAIGYTIIPLPLLYRAISYSIIPLAIICDIGYSIILLLLLYRLTGYFTCH